MKEKYYITTPIYYPSGKFHVGTAYSTILADTIARYKKQRGFDTLFLTGLDEHGQKIEEKAKEANKDPKLYVDEMADAAKKLWKKLDISYDIFMRTTEEFHIEAVQKIFSYFLKNGDIYLGKYSGKYCVSCETYVTDSKANEHDNKCPDCGKELKSMEEEAYFFNMEKYRERLIKYYEENPNFVLPVARKNELFGSFIKEGINDLSITRTSFSWGIKPKENDKHVIYVWLDALTNYITALGFMGKDDSKFKKYWPADVHIIGKDIIRFHAIYWPIFLMALDLPLPKRIYAHNWFVVKDEKMSKSKGNMIYPEDIVDKYELDAFKSYLLKEIPYDKDGNFSIEAFLEHYNYNLANDLGNLITRTSGMMQSYRNGSIEEKEIKEIFENENLKKEIDKINDLLNTSISNFESKFEDFYIAKSIEEIWKTINELNKYIDLTRPWEKYKEEQGENEEIRKDLNVVLYNLYESLRKIAILISPFMEDTANKIFEIFNIEKEYRQYENFNINYIGDLKVEKTDPIFKRLKIEEELKRFE